LAQRSGEARTSRAALSQLLVMRVTIAVPDWVRRSVERGVPNAIERTAGAWYLASPVARQLARETEQAGWQGAEEVGSALSALMQLKPSEQTPLPQSLLALLQRAARHPTAVLRRAGVPHARRDRYKMKISPFDVYGIAPRSLAELHPMLPELAGSYERARLRASQYAGTIIARQDRPTVALIYLARHGRTALNAAGVLRGHLDPPLDQVGRHEAERLAKALRWRGVALVVASPLQRAIATAAPLAALLGLEVEVDERLIDRDYGTWAGQPKERAEAQWGSLDAAPGVEPARSVSERASAALADVAARAAGRAALVVSHDVVNRCALSALDPSTGPSGQLQQGTGCFNTLRYEGNRWTVESINERPPEDC